MQIIFTQSKNINPLLTYILSKKNLEIYLKIKIIKPFKNYLLKQNAQKTISSYTS